MSGGKKRSCEWLKGDTGYWESYIYSARARLLSLLHLHPLLALSKTKTSALHVLSCLPPPKNADATTHVCHSKKSTQTIHMSPDPQKSLSLQRK